MFVLLLLAAIGSHAGELPSVESFTEDVRSRTDAPSPSETLVARVVQSLAEIQNIRTVKFDCGGMPLCAADLIYYEQASVDANVSAALKGVAALIRTGNYKEAAALIEAVGRSIAYKGDKLVPRGVPLYPHALVTEKLKAALAALPAR